MLIKVIILMPIMCFFLYLRHGILIINLNLLLMEDLEVLECYLDDHFRHDNLFCRICSYYWDCIRVKDKH